MIIWAFDGCHLEQCSWRGLFCRFSATLPLAHRAYNNGSLMMSYKLEVPKEVPKEVPMLYFNVFQCTAMSPLPALMNFLCVKELFQQFWRDSSVKFSKIFTRDLRHFNVTLVCSLRPQWEGVELPHRPKPGTWTVLALTGLLQLTMREVFLLGVFLDSRSASDIRETSDSDVCTYQYAGKIRIF